MTKYRKTNGFLDMQIIVYYKKKGTCPLREEHKGITGNLKIAKTIEGPPIMQPEKVRTIYIPNSPGN